MMVKIRVRFTWPRCFLACRSQQIQQNNVTVSTKGFLDEKCPTLEIIPLEGLISLPVCCFKPEAAAHWASHAVCGFAGCRYFTHFEKVSDEIGGLYAGRGTKLHY